MLFHFTLMSRSVMNRAFTKALLSLLGAFLLQSGIANAQTGAGIGALGGNPSTSNSFVIKNTAGEKVTFGISSTGVTNYQLTYPSVVGGAGALLYSTNATGILGWLNAGTNGQVLTLSGGVPTWATPTYGTVTSVGLALPTEFNVTVSPITSSGNLTATWAVEAPNKVFAGPSSGVLSITPSFRSLVAADIPNLDASKITSGLLSSARGGTGIDGSTAANGKVLIGNGTGYSLANITAGNGISITNGSGAITIAATNTGVTSVGLAMPSIFSVTNSPVTSTGTLTASLVTQTAATFFAGPVTGSVAVPTFRPLSATDIPDLSGSYIVNGTSPQIPANFYISGNGTLCGQLQLRGTSTGLSTFQAGAQGTNNINYTLPITAPTANQVLVSSGGATSNLSWASVATGTVTSVGLTMPAVLYSSVGNSPITTSGVLTPVLATQTAATIFAGPATGGATTPTFRALAATDIPNLDASKITTGLLSSARGGTGIDGSSAANGKVLIGNGTGYSLANITAGNGISITNGSGAITIAATNTGVTSVGLAMPSIFSVTNSPVTSTGTLTAALTTQTAATFFAGPTSGSAVTPTFRPLAATDIPDLSGSYIVNGTSPQIPANFYISGNGSLCGQLRLRGTSTGLSTFQAGAQGTNNINYTLPITAPTANQVLISSGGSTSNLSWTDASSLLGSGYWTLSGNSITSAYSTATSTGSFLGTTNTQPLVLGTTNTTTPQPIQFVVNNAERMKLFPSNGYLSLGSVIASPNAPLHIKNANPGHAVVYLQNTSADGYSSVDFENNTGTIGNVGISNSGANAFANQFYFNISAGAVLPMTFNQNTVEKMEIDGNGNVFVVNNFGIGTGNDMNTKLDVDGAISHRPATSTINGSGQITVGNRSYLRITHATNSTNNYTMTLTDGLQDGQILVIQCQGLPGTPTFTFKDGVGNLQLASNFVPCTNYSTISLIWDGSYWVETSRSNN